MADIEKCEGCLHKDADPECCACCIIDECDGEPSEFCDVL